ncbi:hypothetical protein [Streptomyces sp. NPDC058307]|uniref:hypothetical protein n=1 Tax=Streptomyces sp. NPDC058307 TaxID=3346439 RepID=UPI0036E3A84D
MNGYAYANNNPVTRSDPTGLESCGPSNYSCTRDTIDTINKGGGGTGGGADDNDNKGKDKQGKTVVRNGEIPTWVRLAAARPWVRWGARTT